MTFIDLWKICIHMMLFSKYLGAPFFEAIEVKGGRMVKQRDFEAEKDKCRKIKYPPLVLCLMIIFHLEPV
jgi:hypothetical protein